MYSLLPATLLLIAMALPAPSQNALAALRNDYAGPNSMSRVKINGLYAGVDVLGRPVELHIVDGALVHGSFLAVRGARDIAVPQGAMVRITQIASAANAKTDVLRVTIVALGATVPLAFQLPKGSLAGMSEAELRQTIEAVLEPVAAAASPAPVASAEPRPDTAPAAQARPAQTPQRAPLTTENVDELNAILKRHDGDALVIPGGVRATTMTPDNTPDNLIVEGILQPRGQGMYHGMRDVALWPRSHVQFMELRAFTDEVHDLLHLVVRADIGAFAPITWVLPKGQLSSMSKKQIMQVIDPVVVFAGADEHTFSNEKQTAQAVAPSTTPLTAPRPPLPGCEWVPYKSAKYGFELMRQRCHGAALEGQLEFAVRRKPASQPIEAAISQQIIAHFPQAEERTSCRVRQLAEEERPGWHEYSLEPFGAYAHPKVSPEEANEKGNGLCNGWFGGDVSNVVVYNPVVSNTMFFVFEGLSDPIGEQPDDLFSLHMLLGK